MPELPDVCGGPLDPLCQAAGGLAQSATSGVSDMVLGGIGDAFVAGAQSMVDITLAALDASTAVDLSASWFTRNLTVIAIVTLPVVVALFVLQVISAVIRREPGGLVRALVGVAVATVGAALAVAVTAVALTAVDGICQAIASTAGTTVGQAARRFLDVQRLAGPQAGPVLQMLLGLAIMVGTALLWGVLLFRKAALLLVAVFAPVAFAGAVWDHTRSWMRRWVEAVAALVLCKLVIVMVFVLGVSAFATDATTTAPGTGTPGTEATGAAVSDLLVGLVLLGLALLAPWLTFRFVHWSGVEAGTVLHSHLAATPVPAAARTTARTAGRAGQTAALSAVLGQAGAVGGAGGAARTATAARAAAPVSLAARRAEREGGGGAS